MDIIQQTITFQHYSGADELSEQQRSLLQAAADIAATAYAPYSNYQVGCALLMENGQVICGSNQENASFPAGTCAERSALFFAGSTYPGMRILAAAVTTLFPAQNPVAPCGICRQALMEYEMRQEQPIELLMSHPGGRVYRSESISNILPVFFQYKK